MAMADNVIRPPHEITLQTKLKLKYYRIRLKTSNFFHRQTETDTINGDDEDKGRNVQVISKGRRPHSNDGCNTTTLQKRKPQRQRLWNFKRRHNKSNNDDDENIGDTFEFQCKSDDDDDSKTKANPRSYASLYLRNHIESTQEPGKKSRNGPRERESVSSDENQMRLRKSHTRETRRRRSSFTRRRYSNVDVGSDRHDHDTSDRHRHEGDPCESEISSPGSSKDRTSVHRKSIEIQVDATELEIIDHYPDPGLPIIGPLVLPDNPKDKDTHNELDKESSKVKPNESTKTKPITSAIAIVKRDVINPQKILKSLNVMRCKLYALTNRRRDHSKQETKEPINIHFGMKLIQANDPMAFSRSSNSNQKSSQNKFPPSYRSPVHVPPITTYPLEADDMGRVQKLLNRFSSSSRNDIPDDFPGPPGPSLSLATSGSGYQSHLPTSTPTPSSSPDKRHVSFNLDSTNRMLTDTEEGDEAGYVYKPKSHFSSQYSALLRKAI